MAMHLPPSAATASNLLEEYLIFAFASLLDKCYCLRGSSTYECTTRALNTSYFPLQAVSHIVAVGPPTSRVTSVTSSDLGVTSRSSWLHGDAGGRHDSGVRRLPGLLLLRVPLPRLLHPLPHLRDLIEHSFSR